MPKGSAAQQAADWNIMWHIKMGLIFGINKATDTNSDYVMLIYFHAKNGYANQRVKLISAFLSYSAVY